MLKDVLCVPQLCCNLISIAQLIDDLFCSITFTKKLCMIQDLTMRILIGVGEPRKGEYFPDKSTRTVQVNKVSSYEIWHKRLGHPSSQALSNFSSSIQVELDGKKDTLCHVCLRAKQTRLSFLISNNKALNNFDLIHCDIWGDIVFQPFVVHVISYLLSMMLVEVFRCILWRTKARHLNVFKISIIWYTLNLTPKWKC